MAKRLVLAAQLPEPPEPLELELPSGKVILATPLAALSSEQQNHLLGCYRRLVAAQHQLRNAKEHAKPRIYMEMLETVKQLTRVFVPSITDEELRKLKPEQQLEVVQWWIDEHPELKFQATAANQPLSMTQPSPVQQPIDSQRGSSGRFTKGTQRRFGRHRNG